MATYPTVLGVPQYTALATSEYQCQSAFVNGTLSAGSNLVTSIASLQGISVGSLVFGNGVAAGTTVATLGTNAVALSAIVSVTGTEQLAFFFGPSPKFMSWLTANLQLGVDVGTCLQSFAPNFTLFSSTSQQAVGAQLDILGVILGQSRNVPVLTPTIVSGGTSYVVGDTVTVVQSGGMGMTLQVSSVSSGVVTGLIMLTPGTGYSIGSATVTGGDGI